MSAFTFRVSVSFQSAHQQGCLLASASWNVRLQQLAIRALASVEAGDLCFYHTYSEMRLRRVSLGHFYHFWGNGIGAGWVERLCCHFLLTDWRTLPGPLLTVVLAFLHTSLHFSLFSTNILLLQLLSIGLVFLLAPAFFQSL